MSVCISNPPYNMRWEIPPFAEINKRYADYGVPPDSNANYAFILASIQEAERAVLILPNGALDAKTKAEKAIRKSLVEHNLIEAVVMCPDNMFEATGISTCLLVLNRDKKTTYIEMIDLREQFEVEKREQKGQYGGASHENRMYKKAIKFFTEEVIDKTSVAIKELRNEYGICQAVPAEAVANTDYCLVPSRHIERDLVKETQEEMARMRSYEDIVADLDRVIKERNLCKLTINENLAKGVGLSEVVDLKRKEPDIKDSLKSLGLSVDRSDYLTLSKKKNEIKFENNSKDQLSSIFLMIFSMWKQHIFYLNNEENRYLAELRDKLIPDLMTGKIVLDD